MVVLGGLTRDMLSTIALTRNQTSNINLANSKTKNSFPVFHISDELQTSRDGGQRRFQRFT